MAHEYHKYVLEDREDVAITHSPPLCGSGNGPEEARSLINFKASGYNNLINSGESLLGSQHSRLVSNSTCLHQNYNQWNQIGPRSTTDPRVMQYFNCVQTSSGHSEFEKPHSESPSMGESVQAAKKQRTSASKTPKPKSSPSSKDPQSVAAKNRRERISERLKILQKLVPNGSKVDLVTMLEKAIAYVKFLQLQAKVLATDEFWPVQGEKAPDISQVKEAIDDILSSQRDRNSISK